jgi:exopolysaccharide biosynthesis polyprenyl glycosylphosphotransferase
VKDVEAIRGIVASQILDEVVVMLPLRTRYDEVHRILEICVEAGICVKLPPNHFETTIVKTEVSRLGSLPMVTHFTGPSNHLQLVAKRVTDVFGALFGLVLLSPLLLAIAASIRLSSPGPILFRHTRVGLSGRRFRMLKFRTMVQNAPSLRRDLVRLNETDGAAFKIEDDPRITPVGRILRRHHLDELPQLWNVLVGDMSLVGPRPLPPREASGSEWWQRRRLSMPPGLTCLWQVEGDHRIPFRRWMEMDLDYIDRWSFWLDLRLIAATFGTLRRGTGW